MGVLSMLARRVDMVDLVVLARLLVVVVQLRMARFLLLVDHGVRARCRVLVVQ